jgi:hypothetical protein
LPPERAEESENRRRDGRGQERIDIAGPHRFFLAKLGAPRVTVSGAPFGVVDSHL